jgi:hypothetical protein
MVSEEGFLVESQGCPSAFAVDGSEKAGTGLPDVSTRTSADAFPLLSRPSARVALGIFNHLHVCDWPGGL